MDYDFYDVVVVGGGASGLVCALECARAGLRTLVLEKDQQLSRKVMLSGNGRCNLTNRYVAPAYYQAEPALIKSVLTHFSFEDCWNYFEDLGVLLSEEENGRIFPATGRSSAVTEALKIALKEENVEVCCAQEVCKIHAAAVQFIVTTKQNLIVHSHYLVLACGSCAYPQITGTTLGYELAKTVGHSIVPPLPVLSGLCLKERALKRLSGVKCHVRTTAKTNPPATAQGEIIFTNYGINGPAALNVSSAVSRALADGPVGLEINFFPQIDNPEEFFKQRLQDFGTRKPKEFLAGLLHEGIINLLIDFMGMRKNMPMNQQLPSVLAHTLQTLTAWPVTATAVRPWQEAMAAAGGVKTSEINYNTCESLRCPNLFITGELLDVDGKSGGFNLHFAWASAITAAQAIKERC